MSGVATQETITLVTAFKTIAPGAMTVLAGIVTGYLAAHIQSRQFIEEWRRARSDLGAAKAVDIIQAMAMDISKILRASEALCWTAVHRRDSLSAEDWKRLRDWEWEVNSVLPHLRGNHVALAAVHVRAADAFDDTFERLMTHLDEMHSAVDACRGGSVDLLAAKAPGIREQLRDLRPLFGATTREVLETFELGRGTAPSATGMHSDG